MSFFAPEVRSTNGRKGADANRLVIPLPKRDRLASFLSGAKLPCRSKEPPICRKQRDPSPHLDRRPIFSKVQNFYSSIALNTTTTSTKNTHKQKPTNTENPNLNPRILRSKTKITKMRCGFLFLGINLCMYENGGVGLKKKERKKKKEEEEEEEKNVGVGLKKEKKKMMLVMWQCTGEGAHWDNLFMELPLSHGSWVLKIVEMCFHFPSSSLIFLSHRITKHESWSPNKMSSVGPISFGSWVMKTRSYHSKLTTSKHALILLHYLSFCFTL